MPNMGGGPAKENVLFLLPVDEPKDSLAKFRSKYPDYDFTFKTVHFPGQGDDDDSAVPTSEFKDVTILVTLFSLPPNPKTDAPLLNFVQLFSAGSNQIQRHPIYTNTDVTISTSSGIHGPQIAEWVIMTALVQGHKYRQLYELQKQRKWGKKGSSDSTYRTVRDLVGQRLGVLGYGSIGRQVARVGKAMGMDVIAFTASPKETPESKKDSGFIVPGTGDPNGEIPSAWYSGLDKKSLHNFLGQDIDLLLVSVPLTDDTRHFLSTEEFKVLGQNGKKPATITNIARGPIIDQPALIQALRDGALAGANLDVTDPEPLPEDSPLWGMENVIVTPHISGVGQAYTERAFQLFEQQLERRSKGEKLLNVVQRKRGY